MHSETVDEHLDLFSEGQFEHPDTSDDEATGDDVAGEDLHDRLRGSTAIVEDDNEDGHLGEVDTFRLSNSQRISTEEFIAMADSPIFDGMQALNLIQSKYSMDYGESAGSQPATMENQFYPVFHLDMISIVGLPLYPIVRQGGFFDNVTFTLRLWQSPYKSRHTINSLPFDLANRTFRLATGASRELWFIVMHPKDIPACRRETEQGSKRRCEPHTAMERRHAKLLSEYIVAILVCGDLQMEGVEPSWGLGGTQSKSISFEKWGMFQTCFMNQWPEFIRRNSEDRFWTENVPAFHAYDHGANVEIGNSHFPTPTEVNRLHPENENFKRSRQKEEPLFCIGCGRKNFKENRWTHRHRDRECQHADGLARLSNELGLKYDLGHIAIMSYAVAVDLNCLKGGSSPEQSELLCLLADRTAVRQFYDRSRDFMFFPLAFNSRYGNFSSIRPPQFMASLYNTVSRTMSFHNGGRQIVTFGCYQGYSNIKRTLRSRPDDLLVTKGIATAALTLSPLDSQQLPAHLRARQLCLLEQLRGQQTPERPQSSTPFARERQRVDAAIQQENVAFRLEQVITMNVSQLDRARQDFFNVLYPILEIMEFILNDLGTYIPVLRVFQPRIFPGVLSSFARLFEVAIAEMDSRFQSTGQNGLDLASSEGVAVLDRLGSYCFTGHPRVLPSSILRPLMTMNSLATSSWPFVSPSILDFRHPNGKLDLSVWPFKDGERQRPLFLHIAALRYRYGSLVAASRQSRIWFSDIGKSAFHSFLDTERFLKELFQDLWIPEMKAFVTAQFRRQALSGVSDARSSLVFQQRSAHVENTLALWDAAELPFSIEERETLFTELEHVAVSRVTPTARSDFARHIYEQAISCKDCAGLDISPRNATWFQHIRLAIHHAELGSITTDAWIKGIEKALISAGIEWTPGSHRSKLTSRQIVTLVGSSESDHRGQSRVNSAGNELESSSADNGPFSPTTGDGIQRICFGCTIPFTEVPEMVRCGFAEQIKQRKLDDRARQHYNQAMKCLEAIIGDPRCDVLLMLVLTLCASTETPDVQEGHQSFTVARRRRDAGILAANLVTRMLWFLKPNAFPQEDDGPAFRVSRMTRVMEQKGNNRILRQLGWVVQVRGSRQSPRVDECEIQSQEELLSLRGELLSLREDPARFIRKIFGSDKIWVDRCTSIIRTD